MTENTRKAAARPHPQFLSQGRRFGIQQIRDAHPKRISIHTL